MKRLVALVTAAGIASLGFVTSTVQAQAKAPGPNGRIAFARQAPMPNQGHVAFTIDPDGNDLRRLAKHADFPKWSPDGTEISIGDAECMFAGLCQP